MTTSRPKIYRGVAKYFLHGIIYSVLLLLFGLVWAFIAAFLVLVGLLLGLLVVLVFFVLLVGIANSITTQLLWFRVKANVASMLGHGFALLVTLIAVNIFVVQIPAYVLHIPMNIFPPTMSSVAIWIVVTFLNGLAGRNVAALWAETGEDVLSWIDDLGAVFKYPLIFGLLALDFTVILPAAVIGGDMIASFFGNELFPPWLSILAIVTVTQLPVLVLFVIEALRQHRRLPARDAWETTPERWNAALEEFKESFEEK